MKEMSQKYQGSREDVGKKYGGNMIAIQITYKGNKKEV